MLFDLACEYPMMAERRVIIVKETQELSRTIGQLLPYVEKPSPTTILVLCYKYGKIDGKTKLAKELKKYITLESKKLYESDTIKWINSQRRLKHRLHQPIQAQRQAHKHRIAPSGVVRRLQSEHGQHQKQPQHAQREDGRQRKAGTALVIRHGHAVGRSR